MRIVMFVAMLTSVASSCATVSASGNPAVALTWVDRWVELTREDVRELYAGHILSRTLPAERSEIAVLVAGVIDTRPATFMDAVMHPEGLWRAPGTARVGRFSDPPRLADLAGFTLPTDDVDAIRRCVPGNCAVKLTATEIRRLCAARSVNEEFRQVLLERVRQYLAHGLRRTADFRDHEEPVDPQAVAHELLRRSPWLIQGAPPVTDYLRAYPHTHLASVESFLYWIETTYTPKPTLQIVHVSIHHPDSPAVSAPDVLVVSRQVYASHYMNGSLSVSALINTADDSRRVLAYLTRAHVDGLDGWLSGVRRFLVERAVRQRGAAAFERQRTRIESWDPLIDGTN